MTQVAEFQNLVLATRGSHQVKFSDIGRAELGSEEYRSESFFKGRPTVGLQVLRQAQANILDVANDVKAMIPLIKARQRDARGAIQENKKAKQQPGAAELLKALGQ